MEIKKENSSGLLQLLFRMLRIRVAEETIAERYPQWKMRCPTHLCTGQEAVAAGVGQVLLPDDFAVSTHRAHGHYLAKGGDLKKMIAEIYGKSTGCSLGKGGSMHLIDKNVHFMGSTAIVGGTIPLGVGLGLSIKLHGTNQVSCVFIGDGAVEEGVFYESVNFAVLKHLPVLFICENNLYSVYSPLKVRQPENRQIFQMVHGMGCLAKNGNGNDVIEVYELVGQAVQEIRQGFGPRFIEFSTYRWREHCGPFFDNDIGYREESEFLKWKEKDPIQDFSKKLIEKQILSEEMILKMEKDILGEVAQAFEFAENSPFPDCREAFTQVYSE